MCPEPVHEVKVRAKRGQGIRGAAAEHGKAAVGAEFAHPGGKACKAEHYHNDKRAYDLGLVFSRAPQGVVEPGKVLHCGIQVRHAHFFPGVPELKAEPCALGRIKVYFCLMQETQILLMGLPVNQHKCGLL